MYQLVQFHLQIPGTTLITTGNLRQVPGQCLSLFSHVNLLEYGGGYSFRHFNQQCALISHREITLDTTRVNLLFTPCVMI